MPTAITPYCTSAEATNLLYNFYSQYAIWNATTSEVTRSQYLAEATLIIDRLNLKGEKTSSTQLREFPRDDDVSVPDDIKMATALITAALLDGADPQKDLESAMMGSFAIGNVRTTYDRTNIPEHILAGVPSALAWKYLRPYLQDNKELVISRA